MKVEIMKMSAEDLRSARPRLIARVQLDGRTGAYVEHQISNEDAVNDEVFDEGFDTDKSPMAPVYGGLLGEGTGSFT